MRGVFSPALANNVFFINPQKPFSDSRSTVAFLALNYAKDGKI